MDANTIRKYLFAFGDWLIAGAIILGVFVLLRFLRGFLIKKHEKPLPGLMSKSTELFYRLLKQTKLSFLLWISIYIGSHYLRLDTHIQSILFTITVVFSIVQAGFLAIVLIDYWFEQRTGKAGIEKESQSSLKAMGFFTRLVIWTLVVLLALDNVPGIEITTLIASLGIGGIAIGLAVKNILSDLFGSLTITLDKPFTIGDTINVGEFTGTVEYIGLKSTRVRSISGEQLIFSNSDLLTSRIRNFQRMERRRVVFTLRIPYDTPTDKLQAIPDIIQSTIEPVSDVTFDRAHFKEFGVNSLIFEVVYYIETSDFRLFMDRQQQINLEVHKKFSEEEIQFANLAQSN
ncbi:MAG: mechanosensitive ion channel family protein [Bellilinea sp.]|jgi:small-conductance mechanosensitive channel